MRLPFAVVGVPGRVTRRLATITLAGEAPVLGFGAVAAMSLTRVHDPAAASTYLWGGSGLAVVALLAAATMRLPFGVTVGWFVQVAAILAGFVMPVMFVVGGIFLALWLLALVQGRTMDELTRRYLDQHRSAGPAGPATGEDPSRLRP